MGHLQDFLHGLNRPYPNANHAGRRIVSHTPISRGLYKGMGLTVTPQPLYRLPVVVCHE